MAKARPGADLRAHVRERARGYCEYCRIEEASTGHEFTLDHVAPESRGGLTTPETLAYACIGCNVRKSNRIGAPDPIDGEIAPLFNLASSAGGTLLLERRHQTRAWTDADRSRHGRRALAQSPLTDQIPHLDDQERD